MLRFLVVGSLLISCMESPTTSEKILLENYRPQSLYKIPESRIEKARFPVIDMHSHPYAETLADIDSWISEMDRFGIEKTILLTYATGSRFDSLVDVYSTFGRFELWCGIDYTGFQESNWSERAIAELERCKAKGATGVGELGDKGEGLLYSHPTKAYGLHIDDARLQPVLRRCGDLGMPVNIHVAEPIWMYAAIDSTNDGLMNADKWHIDSGKEGLLSHDQLIITLENAVAANPETTFIACHFANCSYDLSVLGRLLDSYPNLYADISARFGETATIPRAMSRFYQQYADRLLFGTDMGLNREMYEVVFRILETEDEHFYQQDYFNYHWPLNGFGLSDEVLAKVYHENAEKILHP